MHRSGTSALTGVLSILGAHPGRSLMPADAATNPRGFWESAQVVAINDELLGSLRSAWDDGRALPEKWWEEEAAASTRGRLADALQEDFGNHPLWVIKDPRLCRLLPVWGKTLSDIDCQPQYVLCLRHPAEVCASLLRRDGMVEPESCLLWLAHMLEAELYTRYQQRIVVRYQSLLEDWRHVIQDISRCLRVEWQISPDRVAGDVAAFLAPTLRHHMHNGERFDDPMCRLAVEAYELLAENEIDTAALDDVRQEFERLRAECLTWMVSLMQYRQQSQPEIARLRTEIDRMKGTASWKLTKPLRFIANLPRLMRLGSRP
jgi:hypothetical protein